MKEVLNEPYPEQVGHMVLGVLCGFTTARHRVRKPTGLRSAGLGISLPTGQFYRRNMEDTQVLLLPLTPTTIERI
jgi:hypothetical protein